MLLASLRGECVKWFNKCNSPRRVSLHVKLYHHCYYCNYLNTCSLSSQSFSHIYLFHFLQILSLSQITLFTVYLLIFNTLHPDRETPWEHTSCLCRTASPFIRIASGTAESLSTIPRLRKCTNEWKTDCSRVVSYY